MRFRNGMTSVVGTALAVVAAGSLVLFSVVLQNSAFDAGAPRPLEARTPGSNEGSVQVPGFEEDSEGSPSATEPEGSPLSTDAGDLLSPLPSDDLDGGEPPLVAAVEPPAGGDDDPTFEGGTGVGPGFIGGPGSPSLINGGPQATINNDQNAPGQPGHEPLPPNNGPKNVQPPHGPTSPGDSEGDDRGSEPDSPGDIDDHAKPGQATNVKDDIPVNQPGKAPKDKTGKKDSKPSKDSEDSKDSKDSKDSEDSEDSKDSKPKANQPKPPEPKNDDDRDNDDDDRRDDDSRDGRDSDHSDVSVS
ncbi:MAG: hypothetical protein ACRDJ2_00005, partial [Actinomycetota bacterium]